MFVKFENLVSEKLKSKLDGVILSFTLVLTLLIASTSLALAQGNGLSEPARNYEVIQGWYQGRATYYYEFGANSPATADRQQVIPAPIYVLVTGFDAEGNPQVVSNQGNIVDVIPGDEGYSDLWQVTFVTVPQDYQANTLTSAAEILNGGYELTRPGIFVNCPIAPAGSTLAEGGADLVQGWYKGQEVYYFDFGQTSDRTAPIYAFITGFNENNEPQFVEGQQNIIDVIPGDEGYTPFWNVNFVRVPADYTANSITSADQLLASGFEIMPSDIVVNCPVTRTPEATPASNVPASLPATGGDKPESTLSLGLIAGGITLIGLSLVLRARKA